MPLFKRDTEICRDRDALREGYQPEKLVGHDEELRTFQAALQPVINGRQPNNIFLYGKTGVGKTATSRYLFGHLREDAGHYGGIHLTIVFLNCDGLTDSYQIATRLANEFQSESNQISTTGYPLDSVYEMLWQGLDDCGRTIIIILDEIDHVNDDSTLYRLPRTRANGNLDAAKVGLIGISSDFSFRDNLSPKVRSSLCEQEIHFPACSAKNLQTTLEQHAKIAFREGILFSGVMPLCVTYETKGAGSARQPIGLLMRASDLARDDNTDRVEEEHIERGRRTLERGRIKEGISRLAEHGHLVLYSLSTLEPEDETPIRSRDVRPHYTRSTKLANRGPLIPRRMRDHLSELAMLGIVSVTERNKGRCGGTYRGYALDMDVGLIASVMRDAIRLVGVHETVEPFLDGDKTSTLDDFIEQ